MARWIGASAPAQPLPPRDPGAARGGSRNTCAGRSRVGRTARPDGIGRALAGWVATEQAARRAAAAPGASGAPRAAAARTGLLLELLLLEPLVLPLLELLLLELLLLEPLLLLELLLLELLLLELEPELPPLSPDELPLAPLLELLPELELLSEGIGVD